MSETQNETYRVQRAVNGCFNVVRTDGDQRGTVYGLAGDTEATMRKACDFLNRQASAGAR